MLTTAISSAVVLASILTGCQSICNYRDEGDAKELRGWSGTITVPQNRSSTYLALQDCVWNIRVSAGSKVKVKVTSLDLEEGFFHNQSPDAEKTCFDHLLIKDSEHGKLYKGCGKLSSPLELISSSNELTVMFHSDQRTSLTGFQLDYEGVCMGNFSASGVIETPNFPESPPPGVSCEWSVGSPAESLRLLRIAETSGTSSDEGNINGTNVASMRSWPPCKNSPFRVLVQGADEQQESLCLDNPIVAYLDNVTLVYDSSVPGAGEVAAQVQVQLTDDESCSSLCAHALSCNPETVGSRLFPNCECEPGYKGPVCSEIQDACESNPCVNGQCTNLDDGVQRVCTCDAGYTGLDCESLAGDICWDFACANGGGCRITLEGLPYCACPRNGDFTGRHCDIPKGAAYCPGEVTQVAVGRSVVWADTLAGSEDVQPCPADSIGNATRFCLHDRASATGAVFTRPDLSQCVRPEVLRISQDATDLLQDDDAPALANTVNTKVERILNITGRLVNATCGTTNAGENLYPGDLLTTADVIDKISESVSAGISVGASEAVALTSAYATVVENIVDPVTEELWRNAKAVLVEEKVSGLVSSTQKLVTGVIKGCSSMTKERTYKSASLSTDTEDINEMLLNVSTPNVDIQVNRVGRGPDSHLNMFQYKCNSSMVSLPIFELDGSETTGQEHSVDIYLARFKSIANLLSMSESRYTQQVESLSSTVNSDIVSAEVLYTDEYSQMHNPVELTFTLQEPGIDIELERRCVFMNMSANSYLSRWSSDGCFVYRSNDTHVVCHCYHLTNFAVLMDVYGTQENIESTHDDILTYVSYIGGCLSIISCLVAIGVFQFFRLSNDRIRIHQQLGFSIVFVQTLYICVENTGENYDTPVWSCRTLAIMMHYALTSLFCWMMVEGIHLYVVLVKVFKHGSHFKKYSAIGYGVPVIVVAISVGAFYDRYGTGNLCWIDTEVLLVCFVPTVGLVLMINTVVLITVIRVMTQSNTATNKIAAVERSNVRAGLKATVVLLPLLGLTWVLGFLAVSPDQNEIASYIFTYLFTITNSCQGILFLVLHCLLNNDVHQAYERRYARKKRLSYIETTSSRLRKISEPELINGSTSPSKSSRTTTRSSLTNISLGLPRLSFMGITRNFDKHPIMGLDDGDVVTGSAWNGFLPAQIPETDFQRSKHRTDELIAIDNSVIYSVQERRVKDDASSDITIPRPHRSSVRFSDDGDTNL